MPVEDAVAVLRHDPAVPLVAAVHVAGAQQRRLDREDTSFSELLDRVRVQQVSLHFANRSLRLTDVAHLLGYSTLASFSAWYRSRFHETPTRARAKAQADRIGLRPPEMCEQTIDLPLDMPSDR